MSNLIYVYDGDCALCSRFVRFLLKHEKTGTLKLATAQSPIGRQIYLNEGLCPDAMETAILKVGEKTFLNMDLFSEGLSLCGWPWKAAIVLKILPRPVTDWVYRRVANNRKRFNSGQSCPMPSADMKARFLD